VQSKRVSKHVRNMRQRTLNSTSESFQKLKAKKGRGSGLNIQWAESLHDDITPRCNALMFVASGAVNAGIVLSTPLPAHASW
jgi:hypothetical protein